MNRDIRNLFNLKDNRTAFLPSPPNVHSMRNGEFCFAMNNGSLCLYAKYRNILSFLPLLKSTEQSVNSFFTNLFSGDSSGITEEWSVESSSFSLEISSNLFVDTSFNTVTGTISNTLSVNSLIRIKDYKGTFGTYNFTLSSSKNFMYRGEVVTTNIVFKNNQTEILILDDGTYLQVFEVYGTEPRIYTQSTEPTVNLMEGDIWIDTSVAYTILEELNLTDNVTYEIT